MTTTDYRTINGIRKSNGEGRRFSPKFGVSLFVRLAGSRAIYSGVMAASGFGLFKTVANLATAPDLALSARA